MTIAPDLHANIANALIGLTKQLKALRYYPPHHPVLQAAAEENLNGFRPLLQDRPFTLAIRKDGFLYNGEPVGKTSQVLGQLAMFCFARRIQHLTILPDLTAEDLQRFVAGLAQSPHDLIAAGGIAEALDEANVTTICVNEQDLDAFLARRQRNRTPSATTDAVVSGMMLASPPQVQRPAQKLAKLLWLLEQTRDDLRFHQLLQELVPLVRLNLTSENRTLVLRTLALLCRLAIDRTSSAIRCSDVLNAIGQLATEELTDYLAAGLLSDDASGKARRLLANVLVFMGDKVVHRLVQLLAEEPAAVNRKRLSEVLLRIGAPAVPILQEQLGNDRWYVVRNAVLLLGELRSHESLMHLIPLLEHDELRVRSETIRALARIGGEQAIDTLLQAAVADDQGTRRQALLSLGSIRAACAIPTLLKLLETTDLDRRSIDMKKDAIRALGEIGSAEAVAPLARILGERRLWQRARHNELRMAAATALGEIADEGARKELEKAARDRSSAVARAAKQALGQMKKEL